MVYYQGELRWASSDNTSGGLDASSPPFCSVPTIQLVYAGIGSFSGDLWFHFPILLDVFLSFPESQSQGNHLYYEMPPGSPTLELADVYLGRVMMFVNRVSICEIKGYGMLLPCYSSRWKVLRLHSYMEIRGSRLKNTKIPTVRRPTSWRNDCGVLQAQLISVHRECFAIWSL